MKKLVLVILLLSGVSLVSVKAQSVHVSTEKTTAGKEKSEKKLEVTGGIKLEANYANFVHSGISEGKSKMKPGTTMGGFLNVRISGHFSIQGEMLFHFKESDFDWESHQKSSFQYWGAEIPIYAMYHWEIKKSRYIHIGIGPYTEFGFSAKLEKDGIKSDLYNKDRTTGIPIMRDSNSGFGILIGYEFPCRLQMNAGYKLSISNLLDGNSGSVQLHPQTLSIGLAYRFGN